MTHNTTSASSSDYLLEEGMTVNDKWKIQNFIAKGGKGEVYLAKQLNLNRQVALKIMSQDFIKSLEGDEEEITSETMRFHREVQVMARMRHTNILQVFDFDKLEINGMEMDYIVMEYVPGQTLRQEMPEEGFGHDEDKVKTWLRKFFFPILDGMEAVHNEGVVHRDMKPENVLVDDGTPKIMDFGIAGGYHMDNVTQTHHMLGTITYMPEEQFMDLALTDARVDIYALGKILYETVEGKMKKGQNKPFHSVALNNPETNFFRTLDRIIQQATAKKRNIRTPSIKVLGASLRTLILEGNKKDSSISVGNSRWKHLFNLSISLLIIFGTAVTIHHYLDKNRSQNQADAMRPATEAMTIPEFNFERTHPTSIPIRDKSKKLAANFFSTDGMTMILVDGDDVVMPVDDPLASEGKQIEKTVSVNTFYMDKTKITNHLYVQFLNEADGISVAKKTVLWNGHLLLLLGEVREGYEPITFKDGEFRVKSRDIAKPVVRVTPLGAMAYAQFYGKTLPLMEQWWLAVKNNHDKSLVKETSLSLSNPQNSKVLPVTHTTADPLGIQGLEQNVNEWTMSSALDGIPEFHYHGGVGELDGRESYLERQPWEAFSSVGFRTVLNLERKK